MEHTNSPKTHTAPEKYLELHAALYEILSQRKPDRPFVIGVDGAHGAGKTSLAGWLAWQLGLGAIHLDHFLIPGETPLKWESSCLEQTIEGQLTLNRVILLEGVLLLSALNEVRIVPDYLIFVGPETAEPDLCGLAAQEESYFNRVHPRSKAQFCLDWIPPA